eukprot:s829_g6.t1
MLLKATGKHLTVYPPLAATPGLVDLRRNPVASTAATRCEVRDRKVPYLDPLDDQECDVLERLAMTSLFSQI